MTGRDAVILAAGQGTRMQSSLPKVLHAVGGKPLLEHVIQTAQELNPSAVHVVIGYGGQQVQDGVGGAAHGHVQAHGVFKGFKGGDAARQHAGVVLFVVALGQFDNGAARLQEQRLAVGVGGHQRAIARQRQAQRFGQAVH